MLLQMVVVGLMTILIGHLSIHGDYHLITEGTNELTSKISCFDIPSDTTSANATKYYTVNVTGISTQNNINSALESNRSNTSFSNQDSVVYNNGSSFIVILGI